MNKYILIFVSLVISFISQAHAGVTPKDAYKAVLNIFAYDVKGNLLHSGVAFYVNEQGDAVSSYEMFQGAERAVVVDSKGKKYSIHRILGANSTFNLVKFRVKDVKKFEYFKICSGEADIHQPLNLVKYATGKDRKSEVVLVDSIEPFNDYSYYHVSAGNNQENMSCPLIDDKGTLVAIVQRNFDKQATTACAIDARFINDLQISATSCFDTDLQSLIIPKALPQKLKDAQTYLYMFPQSDSLSYELALSDFIEAYPKMADGYVNRAIYFAGKKDYNTCEKNFEIALQKTSEDTLGMTKDAVYYNLSNLVYRTCLLQQDSIPVADNWTLSRAGNIVDSAYAVNPSMLYLLHKGRIQFAMKNYSGACDSFLRVCEDKHFASSETFFSAARALELSSKDSLKVIELLDSCIAYLPQPVSMKNAQYYLERSQRLLRSGRYRDAVFDYNEYEQIVGPRNLNEQFYYLREQAEMKARMYQQALDDIRTAIAIAKDKMFYRLEEALILLRVGEYAQAIDCSAKLLQELPENPDCYKIIGIANGELGNKKKAQDNLNRALELGDRTVIKFLEKYQ